MRASWADCTMPQLHLVRGCGAAPVAAACGTLPTAMDLLDYVRGCTFDDFLLTPQCGVLPRRDPDRVDLSARFSEHLTLKRPLVSANMDTVTRAAMAIVLAEEGGVGVIDRGFRAGDIEPQVA